MNDEFYKSQYFQGLDDRLARMELKQDAMQEDIEAIKNQRSYLMGIVFIISVIGTMVWNWILAKISNGK